MALWKSGRMKLLSLLTLTLHNSVLMLVLHYSRVMPPVNGHRYYASTAIFLTEVMKFTISLSMALYDLATEARSDASVAALFGALAKELFTGDSWTLAIPAILYTVQNTLQYVGISNLDATTFQVTAQIKILVTALFSVMLLRRSLGVRKWFSLGLLMVGVVVVQLPIASSYISDTTVLSIKDLHDGVAFHSPRNIWDLKALGNAAAGQLTKRSATYAGIEEDDAAANPIFNPAIGVTAVVIACICSSLAGVYFEKILKDPARDGRMTSLWIRNVQLSFYSLWPALLVGVIFQDGAHIARNGFLAGYNWVVWTAICLQALGGVLVSLVIKHTDNIAKNFASSIAILISFLASVLFFEFQLSVTFMIGTALVLGATYLYHNEADHVSAGRPPPIKISDFGKGEQSYFDLESVASGSRTPLRDGALSTSRPSTPALERRGRVKTPGLSAT